MPKPLEPQSSAGALNGPAKASVERRMRFAARSRYVLDSLAGALCRRLNLTLGASYHLVLDRFLQLGYDLGESIRTVHIVPCFGNVRATTPLLAPPVPQVRGDEGFCYDEDRHVLVGTQVGVDLILGSGKYYVLDVNADAAMRPERRELFPSDVDPVVSNLVETADQLGFRHLVVIRWHWEGIYEPEWVRAGAERGVEVIAACYPWFDTKNPHFVARFPRRLEDDTMYVSFGPRYSPFEFFVNDKLFSHRWMSETLSAHPELARRLAVPETSNRLTIPEPDPDDSKPNLVIKAAGKQCGKAVAMARVTTKEEALNAFGMSNEAAFPRVLRESPVTTFLDKLFARDRLLFQHFVAPTTDDCGHAQIFRLHLLISPLAHRLLAVHRVVAPTALPSKPIQGLVPDPSAYIVNYSRGGTYRLVSAEEEDRIGMVAEDLGELIQTAAKEIFSTALSS